MTAGMRTAQQLALELLDLVLELVHNQVDCREGVARCGLGADQMTMAGHGHFTDVLLRDPRVLLLREEDLRMVHPVEEPRQPGHLLLDSVPEAVGYLDVATADRHVQERSSLRNPAGVGGAACG